MATIGIAAPLDRTSERPWVAAFVYMALLSGFFYLSYGLATWAAGQREVVPSLAFGWERHVPFLAWTVVPYWSLNLFYCASFFVHRTRPELDRHAMRLFLAQIISVTAFLVFPLRLVFERPAVQGLAGTLFDALASFDGPYNLVPSLHLSIAVIVGAALSSSLEGFPRRLLKAWFVLIGASALTTYQHQFIDIPAGIWVGALCCVLIGREKASCIRSMPLSAAYLAGSLAFASIAAWQGGWFLLLWWPAGSCAVVSAIYLTGRADWFGKRNGSIRPAAQFLLGPYLAAAWINSRVWTLRQPPAHEIADGVWLGRMPSGEHSFASIVDLTAELPAPAVPQYRNIAVLDLTAPTQPQIDHAVAAIETFRDNRPTLVCCALGYGRSASAVAAWLVRTGRATSLDEAVEQIRESRPGACPVPGRFTAMALDLLARAIVGRDVRGNPQTAAKQRIYIANHSSHADFLLLWSALPESIRRRTHPVAAADYWKRGPIRRYLAERVFRAVLVERDPHARDPFEPMMAALRAGRSLIVFPEGTRGNGTELLPFKCGIYQLARTFPEADVVPVWIGNLGRVLPRGAVLPAPLLCSVTFGQPTRLLPDEDKREFLNRLRQQLIATGASCSN